MQKQNHSFVYFFAWLIIGAFLGSIILLYRGDISIGVNQTDDSNSTLPASVTPTQNKHTGFADAVKKAAPAVVSIQTIIWSKPGAENQSDEKIIQRFLAKDSPHRPKRQAETGSGSGVIIKDNGYILTNYHVISQRDEIRVRLILR